MCVLKRCSKCGKEQCETLFRVTVRNTDKSVKYRSSWCNDCHYASYRKTKKCADKVLAFVDEVNLVKECLECKVVQSVDNFEKAKRGSLGVASYCRPCKRSKYYDKDRSRIQTQKYRKNNRASYLAYHRICQFNRVSNIKAVSDGTVTKEFAEEIYQTEKCYWCRNYIEQNKRTMEHLIELNSGGLHSASNIVMACRSCNSSRFNKGVTNVTSVS